MNAETTIALKDIKPRITVVGVGGAGNNAVNNMIRADLQGVQYMVCNTDAQHLSQCLVEPDRRIQLGMEVTQGLGAGSRPEVGRAAAEESIEDVMTHLKGCNMVFVTAGMGGGTGTGAAPVIARTAREMGILTVGVVTKPFNFEGPHRMRMAEQGIKEMTQYVDTLIVIPNQNLFRVANEKTTFAEAFSMADHVLYSGVRGVTDLMMMPGLINLDFADIRAVMTEMGKAMMGTGEAKGEGRAIAAAEAAIANPLLDDVSMKGAKGVLINITGGLDMTLYEVDEAANRIREEVGTDNVDTNIIFGSTFDERMEGTMRVSVVATGIDAQGMALHAHNQKDAEAAFDDANDDAGTASFDESTIFIDPQSIVDQDFVPDEDDVHVLKVDDFRMDESYEIDEEVDNVANDDASNQDEGVKSSKKRGFMGRFFDTLAGRNEDEDAEEEIAPPTKKAKTARTTKAPQEPVVLGAELDEHDVQDIPAYLRRK